MPNLQNSAYTPTRGSGRAALYEVSSTGSRISEAFSLPFISASTLTDSTPQETRDTEGSTQFTSDGVRTASFTATLMQTDPATMTFMTTNGGKYFAVVKEINETPLNNERSYIVMPKAKLSKELTFAAPGGEIEALFSLENPGSSYSAISLACFGASTGLSQSLSGTYAPANNEYFKVQTVSAS